VQFTLQFDLSAPLAAPRWLDGPQAICGHEASRYLAVIIDVRYLVPATGSSTPVGFTILPVLRSASEGSELYVATGVYQLPLFKGLPAMPLLAQVQRSGDVHGTLQDALKVLLALPFLFSGRLVTESL
jgi:hypothetical protein